MKSLPLACFIPLFLFWARFAQPFLLRAPGQAGRQGGCGVTAPALPAQPIPLCDSLHRHFPRSYGLPVAVFRDRPMCDVQTILTAESWSPRPCPLTSPAY